jgi:hypothetical protein
MWLFLPFGFFSVVAHRTRPERVLVRARRREHLTELGQRGVAGVIQETSYADYPFRIEADREAVAAFAARHVLEMGYDNFKAEAGRKAGRGRERYVPALHDVWTTMRATEEPRAGARTATPKRAPRSKASATPRGG